VLPLPSRAFRRAQDPEGRFRGGHHHVATVCNKDNKLTVKLNGEVVNEVDLTQGKVADRPQTGWIGFQDHGLPLGLRNIKIREL
jgi:hypothetical protein